MIKQALFAILVLHLPIFEKPLLVDVEALGTSFATVLHTLKFCWISACPQFCNTSG
jgi:hypothetical protein